MAVWKRRRTATEDSRVRLQPRRRERSSDSRYRENRGRNTERERERERERKSGARNEERSAKHEAGRKKWDGIIIYLNVVRMVDTFVV